jgi:hypothetical protein
MLATLAAAPVVISPHVKGTGARRPETLEQLAAGRCSDSRGRRWTRTRSLLSCQRRLDWSHISRIGLPGPARGRRSAGVALGFAHFRARPRSKAGVGHGTNSPAGRVCRVASATATTGVTLGRSEDPAPACGMSRRPLVSNKVSEHKPITGLSQRSSHRPRPSVGRPRGLGERVIRARPRRVTRVRCRRSARSRQNQRVRSARRLRAVRFASISSEARSAWLRRCSRSCWSPSLARSRSCSCSSPRSPGGGARRAGPSACSARSTMTAPAAAVPVANRSLRRRHRSRREQGWLDRMHNRGDA